MKLEHMSIPTVQMRKGMTLLDFFEECASRNVPGLPYVDDRGEMIGRISMRHVYKHMAIPDHVLRVARMLGDQTDRLDLPEMKVLETLEKPVETYLLESIPSVSPRSSIVKALAIMELCNTSYVFLVDDDGYKGVVTRMLIAKRMLECVHMQVKEAGLRGPEGDAS